jgi:type IV pilus assembly protein PilO
MRLGIREAVFLLLLLATPVLFYFLYFQGWHEARVQALEQVRRDEDRLAQFDQAQRQFDDMGQELERLAAAIARFEEKLPAQREVEVILKEVWELAARNRLTPKRVQTDKPVAAADYAEQPIKMQITGDFDGFYQFMLELEKLPRITRTLQIKLNKDPSAEGMVNADLILSIFFETQNHKTHTPL